MELFGLTSLGIKLLTKTSKKMIKCIPGITESEDFLQTDDVILWNELHELGQPLVFVVIAIRVDQRRPQIQVVCKNVEC
jgi:hypothetical protein